MRFLVDNNLSPRLADLLESSGHQAVHVRNCGLQTATDAVLLQRGPDEGRTLISADIDFGALLARERATSPSVILFRSSTGRRAADVASVILANLDAVADDLHGGRSCDRRRPAAGATLLALASLTWPPWALV